MRIRILTALLGILWAFPALAQLENKGWWTRDLLTYRSFHDAKGGDSGLGRTTGRFLTQPEFGYALNKRCLVGLITQYSNTFERQTLAPNTSGLLRSNDRFFGAGPLFRYFIPLGKRVALMPEVFFTYFWGENTRIYSNMGVEEKNTTTYGSVGAGAFPSLVCFLTRDIALSLTVASVQYYGNKDSHSFIVEVNPQQWLLGVEYYFEKKKGKE
jgi:hypothetical protein